VYSTVRGALRGLAELHEKQPALDLTAFEPALARLEQSPQRELQKEAKSTELALKKTSD
jgi:hypothetical protein